MFGNSNTIEHPFGITVFGSTLLRVPPDSVTVRAAITRLEERPVDAFGKAREAEGGVTAFLRKTPVKECGLSRISLAQEYRFSNNERRPIGYVARIGLTVVLTELDQIEHVVSGLVDAGVNEITSTEFHTAKLKELRARARELAVLAAREKAEIYAAAGRVSIGEILHIQDVNPNVLRQEFHVTAARGGQAQESLADNEPEQNSLDPSAIQVGAAVIVAYRIVGSAARELASRGGSMPEIRRTRRRRPR